MGKKGGVEQRVLLVALIIVVILVAFWIAIPNLSTTGGNLFQGQQAGVAGIKIAGGSLIDVGASVSQSQCFAAETDAYVGTGWPASCSFSWGSSSDVSPEFKITASVPNIYSDAVDISYSVGNLVALCSADSLISAVSTPCASVNYGKTNTTGYIVPYQFSVDITTNQLSSSHITVEQLTVVNEIKTFTWNNIPPGYQSVNQSTIYGVVSDCTIGSGGGTQSCSTAGSVNNANVQPEAVGSQVALYSDPNLSNLIGTTCPGGNCLPSASNPFPSTYMASVPTYFGSTLSTFGAYGCGFGGVSTCWPSIHLVITVYTFLVGTYIKNSVNPNTQTQSNLPGVSNQNSNPLNGLFNWLANPLNLGILTTLIVAVIIFIIVITIVPRLLLLDAAKKSV